MKKNDLTDLTFIIPIRIDSDERLENLNLVIELIKNNFDTKIIVLEADKNERVNSQLIDKKIFIEDYNPVFHHTKYRNYMTIQVTSPFIAIWDTDILIPPYQILKAVNLIRKHKTSFVIPYDGKVYKVDPVLKRLYSKNKILDCIIHNLKKMPLMYGHFSVGGAFIVNKIEYCKVGMENEKFYGWGPEDAERVKRWEILGYNVKKVDGPLFHLHHPRKENSWFGSEEIELINKFEFIRICKMKKDELIFEIQSWNNK
ncbi:MAG: hypothetical protein HQ521_03565 [Bacteroidetes bacterium]|nr:hypothetical protein [Bacteroidota bacterium]